MRINDSPSWIREFLEQKAPWWLKGPDDYLQVVSVDDERRVARIQKDGFLYTIVPAEDRIL